MKLENRSDAIFSVLVGGKRLPPCSGVNADLSKLQAGFLDISQSCHVAVMRSIV